MARLVIAAIDKPTEAKLAPKVQRLREIAECEREGVGGGTISRESLQQLQDEERDLSRALGGASLKGLAMVVEDRDFEEVAPHWAVALAVLSRLARGRLVSSLAPSRPPCVLLLDAERVRRWLSGPTPQPVSADREGVIAAAQEMELIDLRPDRRYYELAFEAVLWVVEYAARRGWGLFVFLDVNGGGC